MKIIIEKTMFDDQLGRLNKEQIIDMAESKAMFYIARGYAKAYQVYETKVINEQPIVEAQVESVKKRTRKTKTLD